MSTTTPPKPVYRSLSTAAVVVGSLALGLLLALMGKLPEGEAVRFFIVAVMIAFVPGAHLGGLRARGDRVSILREISVVLVAVGGALLAVWLMSWMSR